ncbi:LysM peptidoglycan-binding domain-containing protein [Geodermatophilus sp. SYSU D00742]
MSIRRLLGTGLAMAVVAMALRALTPELTWVTEYGLDLQRAADTRGAEELLLAAVAAVAWAVWGWGLLGLLLTALGALPGAMGALAHALTRRLLPAGARRAAALALGVGLAAGAPALAACGPGAAPTVSVATDTAAADRTVQPPAVADWPGPIAERTATTATPAAGASAGTPTPPAPTTASAPAQAEDGSTGPEPAPGPAGPRTAPGPAGPEAALPSAPEAVPDWPMPAPGTHVVLRGECLWGIATADLRHRTGRTPDGSEVAAAVHAWWQANAAVIGPDPDVLLPGQVLRPPTSP